MSKFMNIHLTIILFLISDVVIKIKSILNEIKYQLSLIYQLLS